MGWILYCARCILDVFAELTYLSFFSSSHSIRRTDKTLKAGEQQSSSASGDPSVCSLPLQCTACQTSADSGHQEDVNLFWGTRMDKADPKENKASYIVQIIRPKSVTSDTSADPSDTDLMLLRLFEAKLKQTLEDADLSQMSARQVTIAAFEQLREILGLTCTPPVTDSLQDATGDSMAQPSMRSSTAAGPKLSIRPLEPQTTIDLLTFLQDGCEWVSKSRGKTSDPYRQVHVVDALGGVSSLNVIGKYTPGPPVKPQ